MIFLGVTSVTFRGQLAAAAGPDRLTNGHPLDYRERNGTAHHAHLKATPVLPQSSPHAP